MINLRNQIKEMNNKIRSVLVIFFGLLISTSLSAQTYWHVTPSGSGENTGRDLNNSWSLETALDPSLNGNNVKPGDIVYLHAGRYNGTKSLLTPKGKKSILPKGLYYQKPYFCKLIGTVDAPIIVRNFPGERTILDGTNMFLNPKKYKKQAREKSEAILSICKPSKFVWIWGLEFTTTSKIRNTIKENYIMDGGTAISIETETIRVLNNNVHDMLATGISAFQNAIGVKMEGNIVYNCGWNGTSNEDDEIENKNVRSHGHGIYSNSDSFGIERFISNNVIFNQFETGLNVYTSKGRLQNYRIDSNISFNNGTTSLSLVASPPFWTGSKNILVGGRQSSSDIKIIGNHAIHISGHPFEGTQIISNKNGLENKQNFSIGYSISKENKNYEIIGNRIIGGEISVELLNTTNLIFKNNFIRSEGSPICLTDLVSNRYKNGNSKDFFPGKNVKEWNNNTFWGDINLDNPIKLVHACTDDPFPYKQGKYKRTVDNYSFEEWKKMFPNVDQESKIVTAPEKNLEIFHTQTTDDIGRYHLMVYNWTKAKEISLNLNDILAKGVSYKLINAQNPLEENPTSEGVYFDGIKVQTDKLTIAQPNGLEIPENGLVKAYPISPEFCVFILDYFPYKLDVMSPSAGTFQPKYQDVKSEKEILPNYWSKMLAYEWRLKGNNEILSVNSSFSPTKKGIYTLTIVDGHGMKSSVDFTY